MKIGDLEAVIEQIAQKYIDKTAEKDRNMVKFVIDRTKAHILKELHDLFPNGLVLANLRDACDRLDQSPTLTGTLNREIMEKIGLAELNKEVIEHRKRIKWEILIAELDKAVTDLDYFQPADIKKANPDLYEGLKNCLANKETGIDWEQLREHLPANLKNKYLSQKMTPEKRKRMIEDETYQKIQDLHLEDVVHVLAGDPKKLKAYLDLTGEGLSETEKARIVHLGFAGLRSESSREKFKRITKECKEKLPNIDLLEQPAPVTQEKTVTLKLNLPEGTKRLLLRGPWNRDIAINGHKKVDLVFFLNPGESNEISLVAYDDDTKQRSPITVIHIEQTEEKEEKDTLVAFLKALKDKVLEDIRKDEAKTALFKRKLEEAAIKKFANDFNDGTLYLQNLIREQKNNFVKKCLKEIGDLFKKIDQIKFPFIKKGEDLMFFQKYCIYKINEKRRDGFKGVILANEPGMGKTVTALSAVAGDESLIICPNAAASTWIEQESKFFTEPFILDLVGHPYAERMGILEAAPDNRGVLTNVEFVRHNGGAAKEPKVKTDTLRVVQKKTDKTDKPKIQPKPKKFHLLNKRRTGNKQRLVVLDEAHFLKNDSQQTKGISLLESDFMLLLTASPWKNPGALCKVMHRVYPDDPRFKDMESFISAFPQNDPNALKALYLMTEPFILRFLKTDVISCYDESRPLNEQPFALPNKEYIDPIETGKGLFTLTSDQEQAIFELFSDWDGWTKKYGHYLPTDNLAKADGIRSPDNRLSKFHALRQIVNNPKYVGSEEKSPKQEAVMEIIGKEISNNQKVLVFCCYHEQIHAYQKLLAEKGIKFATYSGEIRQKGNVKEESGKEIRFLTDKFNNYILEDGKPVKAADGQNGKPISALDYERYIFQNDKEVKVCLSTYEAGAQSVTFTAADAIIKDDLPRDAIQEYQAEDRIHRLDKDRPKYRVRYYSMVSMYDEVFLSEMEDIPFHKKGEKIEDESDDTEEITSVFEIWFKQGTFDEVHYANLRTQRVVFDLLNNGVAADPELIEQDRKFDYGITYEK